jgi:Family of unknown function (DUF6064)
VTMGEWASYSLSDFLMFSPQTYWRLVQRYNQGMWPAQAAVLAVALLLLAPAARPWAWRASLLLLSAAWAWVGWAFHWQRYGEIFLAAPWLAAACWLQTTLLAAAAFGLLPQAQRAGDPDAITGRVIVLLALAAYPLQPLLGGSSWSEAEVFGFMPDPTALATLGWLLAAPASRWLRVGLAVLPALSLLFGLATRWTMLQ